MALRGKRMASLLAENRTKAFVRLVVVLWAGSGSCRSHDFGKIVDLVEDAFFSSSSPNWPNEP